MNEYLGCLEDENVEEWRLKKKSMRDKIKVQKTLKQFWVKFVSPCKTTRMVPIIDTFWWCGKPGAPAKAVEVDTSCVIYFSWKPKCFLIDAIQQGCTLIGLNARRHSCGVCIPGQQEKNARWWNPYTVWTRYLHFFSFTPLLETQKLIPCFDVSWIFRREAGHGRTVQFMIPWLLLKRASTSCMHVWW